MLVAFAAQAALYILLHSMADYSRRAVYIDFTAKQGTVREVSGLPYAELINKAGKTYGVSPELVAAVIKAESSFQPRALSKAGAYGLMQVIPATWRLVNSQAGICNGRHQGDCGSECFYNPELNIPVGTYYLSQLIKRYPDHAEFAVASYNAGTGAVDKYGGIPPYTETTEYVARVVGYWYQISGHMPPSGLAAEVWLKLAAVIGWGVVITSIAILVVVNHLFRRYRSLWWR